MIRITELADSSEQQASGLLLEAAGLRVLVDPGGVAGRVGSLPPALCADERLDAIVLSHAHADHTAGLPAVVAAHPTVPIVATPSTIALLQLRARPMLGALATAQAAAFYETRTIEPTAGGEAWTVRLLPAGHLLGAAMAVFETPEGCVVCSGDVNTADQHTVRRNARRARRSDRCVDVLVLESTYGDREFRPRTHEEARLVEQIRTALERGGHTLIAAPAMGTAQEVLFTLLHARLQQQAKSAIWVDEAIGAINGVYAQYAPIEFPKLARWITRHGNPFCPDDGLVSVAQLHDFSAILDGPPAIYLTELGSFRSGVGRLFARVLAASAQHLILVPAGRSVRHHISQLMPPSNIRAAVSTYGLMSHADGAALAAMAARWGAQLVVINHGQAEARETLRARLANKGINAIHSAAGQTICWPATE